MQFMPVTFDNEMTSNLLELFVDQWNISVSKVFVVPSSLVQFQRSPNCSE